MGFKTILVHLGPDPESGRRLAAAADFARRQDARLIGLYVALPMDLRGVSFGAPLTEAKAAAEREAAEVRALFETRCEHEGLRREFLLEVGDPAEHLARHARYADTVVITQDGAHGPLADYHATLTEYLPFAVGTPVIVVPKGRDSRIGADHVLVSWKSSREASAAVRASLPLLKEAQAVTILTVSQPGDTYLHGSRISAFLAEHGVAVDLHAVTAREHEVGQTILEEAKRRGAELIVLGVYGHNRLRSRILGGVSKHVLENAPVPLLVAH